MPDHSIIFNASAEEPTMLGFAVGLPVDFEVVVATSVDFEVVVATSVDFDILVEEGTASQI